MRADRRTVLRIQAQPFDDRDQGVVASPELVVRGAALGTRRALEQA
jgi:hypothetical protein